jgi:hypothetical protein
MQVLNAKARKHSHIKGKVIKIKKPHKGTRNDYREQLSIILDTSTVESTKDEGSIRRTREGGVNGSR